MTGTDPQPERPEHWRDLPGVAKVSAVALGFVGLLLLALVVKMGWHGFLWLWRHV